jgi:hypothetical protein
MVLGSRERFWRPEDFEGSPVSVAKALSRLTHAGELRRVRRGLYWRGRPTLLGMAPPSPGRVASEIVPDTGKGPAGWSAGLALGLSTQVPRRETIAVPCRAPQSSGSVRFVSRAASVKRRDERLRPFEVALFEVLRDWNHCVEVPFEVAIERVTALIDNGTLRLDRIVRAAATEPPRVRDRLRQLLEAVGRPNEAAGIRPARRESRHQQLLASTD